MKVEIKVPALGESVSSATISAIHKQNGLVVAMDEEILELETDKVNQVLYAPAAGVLSLNVTVDEEVKIGQVLGYVEPAAADKGMAKEAVPAAGSKAKGEEKGSPPEAKESVQAVSPGDSGIGSGKRIMGKEFAAALQAPSPKTSVIEPPSLHSKPAAKGSSSVAASERETRLPMTKIRRVIARRLVEAQQNAAMLTTFNEVDMTAIIALREHHQEAFTKTHGVKLGFMSFFVKAVTSALQANASLNAYIDGDEIVQRHYFDIGVAVSTDRGLVVPVVRGADKLSHAAIEKEIRTFAEKARGGQLSVDDLQGGSFTITNGGTFGSLLSTPILNAPQSGILGMHAIKKRPIAIDNEVVIRPMMYLALSYDHRLVDGKEAVTFLIHIKDKLEDPARELLEV